MHALTTVLRNMGQSGLHLFWLPVGIWTITTLVVLLFFRIKAKNTAVIYHYHGRVALLWGLAAGVIGSLLFAFIPLQSSNGSGISAKFIVIRDPVTITAASAATHSSWWTTPAIWIGGLTALVVLIAAAAALKLGIDFIWLRSFLLNLPTDQPGKKALLSNKNCELLSECQHNINLIFSDRISIPCTFGWQKKYIVLPNYLQSEPEKLNMAVRHELMHILNNDYAIHATVKVIRALFFFHPLVHKLATDITEYREIYCDQQVLCDTEISRKSYAQLLFELSPKSVFKKSAAVNMAVRPSTLKKRIQTMKNITPKIPSFRWSITLMLIFALMITVLLACSDISKNGITQTEVQQTQANMAKAPSGSIPIYIINGKQIPPAEAKNKVSRLKQKYIKTINVLKDSAATARYGKAGKNGVINITLVEGVTRAEAFSDLEAHAPKAPADTAHKKKIFVAVQNNPKLKGGLAALQKKVRYPASCKNDGISGRVTLQFVVNKKGVPAHVHVIRGIGGGCDKAAIKAVKKYARFKPGRERGRAVNVRYSLPIFFKLSGQSTNSQSSANDKGRMIKSKMAVRNVKLSSNGKLIGMVYNKSKNKPLAGANIVMFKNNTNKLSSKGTVTNATGNFSINNVTHHGKLKVSYTGYQSVVVKF